MSELALLSSAMSCQAMSELAFRDWDRNNGTLSYQLMEPTCERYQSLPERNTENQLKYMDLSRKLCFTHDPAFKAGDYYKQIENERTEDFERWTRRKDIGKPYHPTYEETVCDLDHVFFNTPKEKLDKLCTIHTGNELKVIPCPTTCGPHPYTCPNPIR